VSGKQNAVVAIIPARGGSKGVPHKNLKLLGGHPLIAYSIVAALECPVIDRVLVSTDSEEISQVARNYGAEVPFTRPSALASDNSPDMDYMRHALEWLIQDQKKAPDYLIQLRPTTPLREAGLLTEAFHRLGAYNTATGLRSVHALPEPPQKMVGIENNFLVGLFPQDSRPEYYNLPRQSFPQAYHPNGYVDIVKPSTIQSTGTLYGPRVLAQITPVTLEVDTEEDWINVEFRMEKNPPIIQHRLQHRKAFQ